MKKHGPALMGLLALVLCGLLFTACPPDGGGADLPVKTIRFEPPTDSKGGGVQFYTNDPADYEYGFWAIFDYGSTAAGTFEVIVNKLSGNSNVGYGMIFGVSGSDYYRLIITTNKSFQIAKRVSGTLTPILIGGNTWSTAAELKSGFNQNNTLKVVRTGDSPATFSIYFNGTSVTSFNDPSPIVSTLSADTKFGLYAGVGTAADESFPNTPVDIRYTRGASTISPSINPLEYSVSSPAYSITE